MRRVLARADGAGDRDGLVCVGLPVRGRGRSRRGRGRSASGSTTPTSSSSPTRSASRRRGRCGASSSASRSSASRSASTCTTRATRATRRRGPRSTAGATRARRVGRRPRRLSLLAERDGERRDRGSRLAARARRASGPVSTSTRSSRCRAGSRSCSAGSWTERLPRSPWPWRRGRSGVLTIFGCCSSSRRSSGATSRDDVDLHLRPDRVLVGPAAARRLGRSACGSTATCSRAGAG